VAASKGRTFFKDCVTFAGANDEEVRRAEEAARRRPATRKEEAKAVMVTPQVIIGKQNVSASPTMIREGDPMRHEFVACLFR
jgi:hypothetical protein